MAILDLLGILAVAAVVFHVHQAPASPMSSSRPVLLTSNPNFTINAIPRHGDAPPRTTITGQRVDGSAEIERSAVTTPSSAGDALSRRQSDLPMTSAGVASKVNVPPQISDAVASEIQPYLLNDKRDPLARALTSHPRLFANGSRFLQVATSASPEIKAAIRTLSAEAAFLRDKPLLERKIEDNRLLEVSREAVLRIGTLAAVYRLRKDTAAGQAACRQLLAIARFSDWHPEHYLDVGEMTLAAALGYDWCYDLLSPAERTEVSAAIATKGLHPSLDARVPFWVAGNTNWTQVCHAGMIAGALAIHEIQPELARQIINRALIYLPLAMDAIYDPTGNYPEGPMYWSYGTHYNIIAIEALRSVLRDDSDLGRHRGLLASGFFLAHVQGANGQPFCYGDCLSTAPEWASHAAALAWLARENGIDSLRPVAPQSRWKPSLDSDYRFLPFLPLWLAGSKGRNEPLPLDYVGGGKRQVWLARSAWNKPQAAFVGVTGGSPGDSHGHMDAGSFVFELDGVRWAHDLGMHPYAPLEKGIKLWDLNQNSQRWTVFRLGADAHNILRLPGISQNVKGRAVLTQTGADPARPGCEIDLTSIYAPQAARVQRQIRFPSRSALEVIDRVDQLAVTGPIGWQLLTHAKVTVDTRRRTFHLKESGKSLDVTVAEPALVRLTTAPAAPRLSIERPNPGFTRLLVEVDGVAGASVEIRVQLYRP